MNDLTYRYIENLTEDENLKEVLFILLTRIRQLESEAGGG